MYPTSVPAQNPGMMAGGYPGQAQGQGRSLLTSNTFHILPGQPQHPGMAPTDPYKYTVKEAGGYPVLWVMETNGGINPAIRALLVKDSTQLDVVRMSIATNTGVATLSGPPGVIGNVFISAKPEKDHKKEGSKKDGKRLTVLQNPAQQVILSMSGKAKKDGGGKLDMKIKGPQAHSAHGSAPLYGGDKKHKDKDHKKGKDHKKDKDHKDKDKKKDRVVAELEGSLTAGLTLTLSSHSSPNIQERTNIVALIIAYLELEKYGSVGLSGHHAPPQAYPVGVQGVPYGQQQFVPGTQQPYMPGAQQHFVPGAQQPFVPGGQQPGGPGFMGGSQNPGFVQPAQQPFPPQQYRPQ